jgi:hypothetical protein
LKKTVKEYIDESTASVERYADNFAHASDRKTLQHLLWEMSNQIVFDDADEEIQSDLDLHRLDSFVSVSEHQLVRHLPEKVLECSFVRHVRKVVDVAFDTFCVLIDQPLYSFTVFFNSHLLRFEMSSLR